ncbi:MAG TPA: endolytic transglycosylase MltG, partial [Clostridiales bacterium]|nr:endolytic transglycosylase MltG [Clostridiales bacterium]
ENKFRDEFYNKVQELGITVDEAIIIASIIEREAQLENEREIISGVIYNRLNSNDPSLHYLQMDATIQYHYIETTGKVKEVLLRKDTKIDHPYNTYVYPDLPPGPICSPGLNSIIAALYPEEHNYYYYVATGDGSHEFSQTYDQHLAAIRKYQNN